MLYSLDIDGGTITALDPDTLRVDRVRSGRTRPYDVAVARNGTQLFVSDWAGRGVRRPGPGGPADDRPDRRGRAPQPDRRPSPGRSDLRRLRVEQLRLGHRHPSRDRHRDDPHGPVPRAPEGSTPDALAVAPDGKTLYVANADNNCVAVIDIAAAGRSQVKGFIPTGWYPTAVAVTPDGKNLLVGVGKGNQTKPNPIERKTAKAEISDSPAVGPRRPFPYIGTTLSGALSIVPVPDEKAAGPVHGDGLPQLPVLRQAAHRRPASREDGDPHEGRRPVADQARDLHHQGEPDLRSGLRRHRARATATRRW